MGMYDSIYCDYPLPKKGFEQSEFQTKDFECSLHYYVILASGDLHRLVPNEDVSDHLLRRKDFTVGDFHDYTGSCHFYDYLEPDGWIAFEVFFRNGVIATPDPESLIELIEHRPPKEAR